MREKLFRDPVHNFITVTDPLLLRLINAPEFQRLRRIRQLGASYKTYHGAEHSRFGHSLGVMFIMIKILKHLEQIGSAISKDVKTVATCAALLHDIGHGPLSHSLEQVLTPIGRHEEWTKRMIQGDTEVHRILVDEDPALPEAVVAVIAGTYDTAPWVNTLVASQLDVDRMDYLLRDSVFTGVTYGKFDLEWLINTLTLENDEVVLMNKGLTAAEQYVLARYSMYWQVYLHKTTRGQELLLKKMWERAKWLFSKKQLSKADVPASLVPFFEGAVSIGAYVAVDDYDCFYACKVWRTHPDEILSDLARRYLDRHLLKPIFKVPRADVALENLARAQQHMREKGLDPDYYLIVDRTSDVAYDYYTAGHDRQHAIHVHDENGNPCELTRLSDTIRAIASRKKVAINIYVPEVCLAEVRRFFIVD